MKVPFDLSTAVYPAEIWSPTTELWTTLAGMQTPDAANIASVALLRLGSVTHVFNENQRYVPLTFTVRIGSLTVTSPANGNLAPPGNHMLFIVNSSGVPSVASFVQF